MVTKIDTMIPKYITFFLPMVSDSFQEIGLEINALIEKSVIISPLLDSPPI